MFMKRILIVRGWRSKKEHWKKTKDILGKEGFEVLLPDLPGISEEGGDIEKAWSIDDYKNWILKYVENHGWKKFNILGHSFGGAIVTRIASDCPEKVDKLILCAPAVFGAKSLKTILLYLTAQTANSVFSLPRMRKRFPAVKKKLFARGVHHYYFDKGTRKKILKKAAKENHKDYLQKINQKTLILWGEEDEKIPSKYAQSIKDIIPKSKIVIFPKVDHSPHKKIPKEFSQEIIRFIK